VKDIITDTGFWLALCDERNEHHHKSIDTFGKIGLFNVLVPWPVMYEVLRTKFVKNRLTVKRFDEALRALKVSFLDDTPYREKALEETVELSSAGKRVMSLADVVIRYILYDIKVDYLITYNEGDFVDICRKKLIPIYYPGLLS